MISSVLAYSLLNISGLLTSLQDFGITLIAFLAVLSLLVFVHELGHFLAAKRAGVQVKTFSIGMGPKLLKHKRGDTEYCLSGIPLGGYVKLKGENPDEEPTGDPDDMMTKSIPTRFSIFFAGPAMNLLFAVGIVSFAFLLGIAAPKYLENPPIIRWVNTDSPAAKGGLQLNDLIRSVAGVPVKTWEDAEWQILARSKKPLVLEVERQQELQTFTVIPEMDDFFGLGYIGIDHEWKPIITGILKDFPAEAAGIQLEDEIAMINDVTIIHWRQVAELIHDYPDNEPVRLTLLRKGAKVEVSLVPKLDEGRKLLGITSDRQILEETVRKQYGPIESLSRGFRECWKMMYRTFEWIRGVFTRQVSGKTVGGPIAIAQMTGHVVRQGLSELLLFIGGVSLSLGIANLLPIPILDGGHLLFFALEIIMRRPLDLRHREIAQQVGLALLLGLMGFAFYNDILRVIRGWG